MGLLDAILGRSKPVRPDLDQLFALPSAAVTLQAAAGFVPTGQGSVCFASVEGGAFERIRDECGQLLDGPVEFSADGLGYTWLRVSHAPDDVAGLVNDLHAVNTSLEESGFGPHLLCSLIAFTDPRDGRSLALVYLYKRGTFYPFAPLPGEGQRRDNPLELRVKAALTNDLRIEQDLNRWFPLWGAPGL